MPRGQPSQGHPAGDLQTRCLRQRALRIGRARTHNVLCMAQGCILKNHGFDHRYRFDLAGHFDARIWHAADALGSSASLD